MKILKTGTLLRQSRDFGRTSERKKKEKARTTNPRNQEIKIALPKKLGKKHRNQKKNLKLLRFAKTVKPKKLAQKKASASLQLRKIKKANINLVIYF